MGWPCLSQMLLLLWNFLSFSCSGLATDRMSKSEASSLQQTSFMLVSKLSLCSSIKVPCSWAQAVILTTHSDQQACNTYPKGHLCTSLWMAPYAVAHRSSLKQCLCLPLWEAPMVQHLCGSFYKGNWFVESFECCKFRVRLFWANMSPLHNHVLAICVWFNGVFISLAGYSSLGGQSVVVVCDEVADHIVFGQNAEGR